MLEGVRFRGGTATTHSIVMRSKSGTIREVKSEQGLAKLRTYASVDFDSAMHISHSHLRRRKAEMLAAQPLAGRLTA